MYIALLKLCFGIRKGDLRVRIGYRADQDIEQLQRYWSKLTGVPLKHFYKTRPDSRTQNKPTKNRDYKGVCVVSCAGAHVQLELETIARIIVDALQKIAK